MIDTFKVEQARMRQRQLTARRLYGRAWELKDAAIIEFTRRVLRANNPDTVSLEDIRRNWQL